MNINISFKLLGTKFKGLKDQKYFTLHSVSKKGLSCDYLNFESSSNPDPANESETQQNNYM